MKKYLIIIFIIFLISCRNEEDPIYIPETIKIIETVTVEVTKVVEKEKIIYLDATYNPEPTWTPTPTPIPGATWTPTPTPTPVPPGDLGYELVRFTFNINLTELGQSTTVAIPLEMSPIVDSDRDNDLTDEINIVTDPQNYQIMRVIHNKNSFSEITFVSITPTGSSTISFDFYTTKK